MASTPVTKNNPTENIEDEPMEDVENVENFNISTDLNTTPKNVSMEQEKFHATPALIRMKKSKQEFKVNSPSDALMSPCTQMLRNNPAKKGSQPQNLLRNKQHKELTEKISQKFLEHNSEDEEE